MNPTNLRIETLDDFLPDPLAYREQALKEKFYDIRGPDGELYKNINVRPSDELESLISLRLGRNVKCSYSLLRMNFEGELPNNAVHSDNGYDQFAAILYLSRPEDCRGGTGFWKHQKYGWTNFPTLNQLRQTCKKPEKILKQLSMDYNRPGAWELTHIAEMKFNRMIVYPTQQWHSRYPWEAFGKTREDARLIWVSFFSAV